MKQSFLTILFIGIFFADSFGDTINNELIFNDMNIDLIKKHLKLQEEVETEEVEFDNPYELTEKDLLLQLQVMAEGLKQTNYQIIPKDTFLKKMKVIFNIDLLNNGLKCKYIRIRDFYITLYGNKMDDEIETLQANEFDLFFYTQNYFIDKENHFITPQKLLKSIVKISDNKIDIFIDDYAIHQNKYLFNNSNQSFVWLTQNDPSFLNMLVNTFGYVQDTELLKWVLENNQSFYEKYSFDKDKFGQVLMTRLCNGRLIFHDETLSAINSALNEQYLIQIKKFIQCIASGDMFNEIKFVELSFSEKAEIIAKLIAWAETIVEETQELTEQYTGTFIKAFRQKAEFPMKTYMDEFKANNYYGLSDFWVSHIE